MRLLQHFRHLIHVECVNVLSRGKWPSVLYRMHCILFRLYLIVLKRKLMVPNSYFLRCCKAVLILWLEASMNKASSPFIFGCTRKVALAKLFHDVSNASLAFVDHNIGVFPRIFPYRSSLIGTKVFAMSGKNLL